MHEESGDDHWQTEYRSQFFYAVPVVMEEEESLGSSMHNGVTLRQDTQVQTEPEKEDRGTQTAVKASVANQSTQSKKRNATNFNSTHHNQLHPFAMYGSGNTKPVNPKRLMFTHNVKSPRKVYPAALSKETFRKKYNESLRTLKHSNLSKSRVKTPHNHKVVSFHSEVMTSESEPEIAKPKKLERKQHLIEQHHILQHQLQQLQEQQAQLENKYYSLRESLSRSSSTNSIFTANSNTIQQAHTHQPISTSSSTQAINAVNVTSLVHSTHCTNRWNARSTSTAGETECRKCGATPVKTNLVKPFEPTSSHDWNPKMYKYLPARYLKDIPAAGKAEPKSPSLAISY